MEYILNLNPKRVIFNPGTENPAFFKLLERQNIAYEIACTLVLFLRISINPKKVSIPFIGNNS